MTRKDHARFADEVRIEKGYCEFNDIDTTALTRMVERMIRLFTQDNPKFDRAKFWKDCGY